ncbi:MAG: MDR family MFS transporter, partial [Acidimicrobiales bacterium]
MSAPVATDYAARLSRRRIVVTVVAVMCAMFLAALDATVVATAMPTVVARLHGINIYAWVFAAYLLTETATIPLWGKLADMVGRKRVFLAGMALFLGGSALCGLSQTMSQLIAFRAVQGIGAGCLLPVAQTITGDLFTMEQRVKVQAVFSAVFGLASVIGPYVGGILTDQLSWRWVFYVNLPVGVVAAGLVAGALVEPLQSAISHALDWWGALAIVASSSLLVYALETGGRDHPWSSAPVIGCLVVSGILGIAFVARERRASEPLVPLDLFSVPVLRGAAIASLLLGMTMYGVISFLPLFVQTVIGTSATDAGRILTPLMLGLVAATVVGGRLLLRTSYRTVFGTGMALATFGLALLALLGVHSTQLEVSRDMVLMGFGLGLVTVTAIIAAQNSVTTARMGVATSTINFTRQIGGALGVAIA